MLVPMSILCQISFLIDWMATGLKVDAKLLLNHEIQPHLSATI